MAEVIDVDFTPPSPEFERVFREIKRCKAELLTLVDQPDFKSNGRFQARVLTLSRQWESLTKELCAICDREEGERRRAVRTETPR